MGREKEISVIFKRRDEEEKVNRERDKNERTWEEERSQ